MNQIQNYITCTSRSDRGLTFYYCTRVQVTSVFNSWPPVISDSLAES